MDLLNVYVTNLGKYNEMELVGEWLSLPASEEEIQECFKNIGLNEEYEEYFITDYVSDVGLKCSEYTNLKNLNEKIQELEDATNGDYDKLKAVIERDYWREDQLQEVIDTMESDEVYFQKGITAEEYEEEYINECYDLKFMQEGWLSQYITIDYKKMAEEDDSIYENNEGVLIDGRY